jgi:UPF0716 family protein affecting phage T7 exclusion
LAENVVQGTVTLSPRIRAKLPKHPGLRIAVGVLLVVGGILGFLPVLGFWMIPLGLIILSVDLPLVRRWRRRIEVKWGRRNGRPARRHARKAESDSR